MTGRSGRSCDGAAETGVFGPLLAYSVGPCGRDRSLGRLSPRQQKWGTLNYRGSNVKPILAHTSAFGISLPRRTFRLPCFLLCRRFRNIPPQSSFRCGKPARSRKLSCPCHKPWTLGVAYLEWFQSWLSNYGLNSDFSQSTCQCSIRTLCEGDCLGCRWNIVRSPLEDPGDWGTRFGRGSRRTEPGRSPFLRKAKKS